MGPGPCRTVEAVAGARAFPKCSGTSCQLGSTVARCAVGRGLLGGRSASRRTSCEALAVVSRGWNPQRGSDSRDGVDVWSKSY